MGIKRNDSCYTENVKDKIRNGNKINLFDRTELEAKLFWIQFDKTMKHIESLADYVDEVHLPLEFRKVYIDLIFNHLGTIKDLLFVSYGLELDTNPKSKDFITKCNSDNLIALGFWGLDNQKEIESISTISSKWINHFIFEDKFAGSNLEGMFDNQEESSSFLHNIDEQLQRTFIYAPYLGDKKESGLVREQLEEIDETMRTIFSLLYSVMTTSVMLFYNFDALVKEFRESEKGVRILSVWKHDLYLPIDRLLSKLKEKKDLKPWVDKCYLLYEGKIQKNELFVDFSLPGVQHNSEMYRTNSWISIFTIFSILKEYEEQQKVILEVKPFFYNDEDEARKFLGMIRGLEDRMITSLVKKLVDKDKYPEALKTKSFYELLVKYKLYTKCYQNWNGQV